MSSPVTTPIVVRGDARALPLPDASVDLIVTSPPYFALRSYTDGGKHYAGQLGSEATPTEYIAALVECTREWVRVLKPSGSIFVNLGDKYSQRVATRPSSHQDGLFPDRPEFAKDWKRDRELGLARMPSQNVMANGRAVPEKSLMLLPERYRIACVDGLGLIARAVLVWFKPNGLPESVTDRVRRSHEDWVHLTKLPRYFAAVDEIREPHNPGGNTSMGNPLGKLPGSVWTIATEPLRVPEHLRVAHFAAFPSEWPRRLILGWSPSGICTACGEGRRPVSVSEVTGFRGGRQFNPTSGNVGLLGRERSTTITGYACACTPYTNHPGTGEDNGQHGTGGNHVEGRYPNVGVSSPAGGTGHLGNRPKVGPWREYHLTDWTPPPARPAVVLDPCGGTGTTAHVAAALGRIGITTDLSLDYCRLAAAPELQDRRRRKVLGLKSAPARRNAPPRIERNL